MTESSAKARPPEARQPVVLLVEDNPRNLKLAHDVLEHAGFSVHVAVTGEEAVALAASVRPDLVLMDIQLPGIDGYEALAQIRQDSRSADVPVVALTAFAMRRDREKAIDAGFDGYLEKPISVRDFPAQVRQYLRSAAPGTGSGS
ncbi:chemotaxis protein CheY [Intrasporangium oryzae NRRL B-24470]|uniref:Chemotaxis protein CheY n=1 Tax=Intrasporangium oryzae NRRL B-24470 TaxID=1386089 RepID=W9G8X7_9MICO|nr:response regulator [Intrasporangium oryzae]EWT02636.1 chemotaxis protein CheY [Intrasporangium oryzae NRRL B-24470]